MKTRGMEALLALFTESSNPRSGIFAVYRSGLVDGAMGVLKNREARRKQREAAAKNELAIRRRAGRIETMRKRWAHVVAAAAARHGVTVEAMREAENPRRRHDAPATLATHDAAWALRVGAGLTWDPLAGMLHRDRSTLITAVRKREAQVAERPGLREELLALLGPAAEAKRGVA